MAYINWEAPESGAWSHLAVLRVIDGLKRKQVIRDFIQDTKLVSDVNIAYFHGDLDDGTYLEERVCEYYEDKVAYYQIEEGKIKRIRSGIYSSDIPSDIQGKILGIENGIFIVICARCRRTLGVNLPECRANKCQPDVLGTFHKHKYKHEVVKHE